MLAEFVVMKMDFLFTYIIWVFLLEIESHT